METNQSKGKNLEQIVLLIQKAFKDSPQTKIYANHKLMTESGEPREFDIIVETKTQGFNLVIAIECKAHKTSVGAQLVEGFKAKCDRVSKINKMVFISLSGFQKGAISFAEKQNISLLAVDEVTPDNLKKLAVIKRLDIGLRFEVQYLVLKFQYLKGLPPPEQILDIIYYEKDNEFVSINKYLFNFVKSKKEEISKANMEYYIERKNDEALKTELAWDIVADANGMYLKGVSKQKFYLNKIEALMYTAVVEIDSEIEQLKVYKTFGGYAKAHYVKIKIDCTDSAELVIRDEKSIGIRSGKEPGNLYIFQTKNGKVVLSNTTL